jgi:hypothetical protein
VDIDDYDPEIFYSHEGIKMISDGKPGWEPMLPGIAEIIKSIAFSGTIRRKF